MPLFLSWLCKEFRDVSSPDVGPEHPWYIADAWICQETATLQPINDLPSRLQQATYDTAISVEKWLILSSALHPWPLYLEVVASGLNHVNSRDLFTSCFCMQTILPGEDHLGSSWQPDTRQVHLDYVVTLPFHFYLLLGLQIANA